jgi:hypothetical protein
MRQHHSFHPRSVELPLQMLGRILQLMTEPLTRPWVSEMVKEFDAEKHSNKVPQSE